MNRMLCLAALAAGLVASSAVEAQNALARFKVGNNVEGLTWVPAGRNGGRWAALDGWDVVAIEPRDRGRECTDSRSAARPLFSLVGITPEGSTPRGLCFEPQTR